MTVPSCPFPDHPMCACGHCTYEHQRPRSEGGGVCVASGCPCEGFEAPLEHAARVAHERYCAEQLRRAAIREARRRW